MPTSLDLKDKEGSLLGATDKPEKVKGQLSQAVNAKEGTKISRHKTIIMLQKYPNYCEK